MIAFAICTGIIILVLLLYIAYLSGGISERQMYMDEQAKRTAAESDNKHHERCRRALDEKITSQQREIASMKWRNSCAEDKPEITNEGAEK